MSNIELQNYLKQFPDNWPLKIRVDSDYVKALDEENILHTSETAYVDDTTPEDEWDCEDGKIMLGDGQQYLLFNPIIVYGHEPKHVLKMEYSDGRNVRQVALCSERTRYFLSRGFDLFGLIEAGLALDKT